MAALSPDAYCCKGYLHPAVLISGNFLRQMLQAEALYSGPPQTYFNEKDFRATGVRAAALIACNSKPVQKTYFADPYTFCKAVKELNEVVKHVGFAPIVASRNYAYANIAAYECIAAGYPEQYQSLGGQLNGLQPLPAADTNRQVDYEFAALLAFCKVGEAVTSRKGVCRLTLTV